MMFARHTPRLVRFLLAAGRVFGEPLREQRRKNSVRKHWTMGCADRESAIQSGVSRTLSPA